MSTADQRLLVRVARLYHEDGLSQPQIAAQLTLSQAKVSRLLKQAVTEGVVRITINPPAGLNISLEEELRQRFGLAEAIVVDASDDDEVSLMHALGSAAALHIETTVRSRDVVGISSWSSTLLATVNAMRPVRSAEGVTVVQTLGGVGDPGAEVYATELTRRMARLLHGSPVFLPVPGIVGSSEARRILEDDEFVSRASSLFPKLTVALAGIGALEPSPLLAQSGNVFDPSELDELGARGAVGDVCLRFFDAEGNEVLGGLRDRVIGVSLDQIRAVPRSIAVAGGARKVNAIRGALTGRLVTCLVTDRTTAETLVDTA
ncbi:MAG: sugar-binding transcriptional regulator [Ilumatobacteraceae bacterium]|nr:sugar-binding transcriptional regulator [Ilumatobacteraceae bacterium]